MIRIDSQTRLAALCAGMFLVGVLFGVLVVR